MTHRERRTYDHRIKSQVVVTGNPSLFPQRAIPRSTAKSWIRRGEREVVSLEHTVETDAQLGHRVAKLERRVSMLTAVLRLVLVLLHLSEFKLGFDRVWNAEGKRCLLGAIERARKVMPLTAALRVLGLFVGRYYDWVERQEGSTLEDRSSCPRSSP